METMQQQFERYLLPALHGKDLVQKVLVALTKPLFDTLEEVKTWASNRAIDDLSGDALTETSKLFGLERGDNSDSQLKTFLSIRIVELFASGTFEDLRRVLEIIDDTLDYDVILAYDFRLESKTVSQAIINFGSAIALADSDFISILRSIKALGYDWRVDFVPPAEALGFDGGETIVSGGTNPFPNGVTRRTIQV